MSQSPDSKLVSPQNLPLYKEGFDDPSLYSSETRNREVRAINALKNLKVVPETAGKFTLSDANSILEIYQQPGGGGTGSGNMVYLGLYDAGYDYAPNDCVYTAPDSDTRIFWVCEVANGPASSVRAPTWPEPGTVYWRCVAISSAGGTKELRVKTVYGDHLDCCELSDVSLAGATTAVAKEVRNRRSNTSEVVGPYTISYSFAAATGYLDYLRTAHVASGPAQPDQTELLIPVYISGEIITVVKIAGATLDGVSCVWKETNPRKWVQIG